MNEQVFKADAGKRRPSLIQVGFAKAIRLVQATMEYGGIKYEAHSWRTVPDAKTRYFEAAERHRQDRMICLQDGGDHLTCLDDESGLPHLAHEVFNLMALLELELQDARKPGQSNSMLELLCEFKQPPLDHKREHPAVS